MARVGRWRLSVLVGALACVGRLALAAGDGNPPGDPGAAMSAGPVVGRCPLAGDSAGAAAWQARLQGLELRSEQRAAIQAIVERYRTRAWELSNQGTEARERFTATLPDDPAYADATAAAAEAAAAIVAEGVRLMSELRAEVFAVLDPVQQQRLKEQSAKAERRWEEWRERHRAPPR